MYDLTNKISKQSTTKKSEVLFIRASMSLAGLLPPITDNGSMLLDGGYVDNLPVGEMKSRGASIIFQSLLVLSRPYGHKWNQRCKFLRIYQNQEWHSFQ